LETLSFKELNAIYEVDVSPYGRFLVFSGQSGMQADLFLYDMESKLLTRMTNDAFNDAHPRFSPDGKHIAFDSERRHKSESIRYGLFTDIVRDVFTLEIASGEFTQVTSEAYDCFAPFWADKGNKLIFVSNKDNISNLCAIDLQSGTRAELAKTMAGVFAGDISAGDEYLLMANYFNGAWDLYFDDKPLKSLEFTEYQSPQSFRRESNLLSTIDLSRLDNYGKRSKAQRKRTNPSRIPNPRRPMFVEHEFSYEDSLRLFPDFSWDDKPDSISTPVEVKPYRTRFALEHLWGGMAYSSSQGAIGNLEIGLGDLMGNHGIGISLGISGKLEESNLLLSYIYLKHRADYGFGIYNFFDEYLYRIVPAGKYQYYRLRSRETGVNLIYRYPFSRFSRLELDNRIYQVEQNLDGLPPENVAEELWVENLDKVTDTVFAPGLSLVHDNTLSGSTGPLVGWRAIYHIRKSFALDDLEYLTNYVDFRSYSLFSKRYSFAFRLNGGISTGKNPDRFNLNGYYGVRALDTAISGNKKALSTVELRFPFLDYLAIAFPIPLALGNIRGSIFADAGSVWDDTDKFRGVKGNKLEDIKLGYGFGPRLNLGYFVLKFDVAWQTDLSDISKPLYYLSLTEDF
jgi:hypothetical protein